MASKIWKGQRRKPSRGARKRKDRRKKREPPGPRTHPGGGERGVVAAPMSPCRGSDIAFQPRCSRREARAAAPGKYRALLGLQPRPRPPPLPHHPPPPPSNAISTADPIRVHRLRDRPHRTAPRSSAQHQRSDAPHVPLPSPPCIPQGRCATSLSQTAPRGGQVERDGWQLSPQVPSAPQHPPGASVPTSPGEIGARRCGARIPIASSSPPILRAPGAVPGVSRGCSPPLLPPQGQLSVSQQAEPASSCRCQQPRGGGFAVQPPAGTR